jgi:SWIM zinc finger
MVCILISFIILQTAAFKWLEMKPDVKFRTENDTVTLYYIAANGQPKLKEDDITKYRRMTEWVSNKSWKTFDTYVSGMSRLWLVTFHANDWYRSTCTCGTFQKNYICKHIIGLAVKFKVFELRPEAKCIPLCMKRKRGRPGKAKKALVLQ